MATLIELSMVGCSTHLTYLSLSVDQSIYDVSVSSILQITVMAVDSRSCALQTVTADDTRKFELVVGAGEEEDSSKSDSKERVSKQA